MIEKLIETLLRPIIKRLETLMASVEELQAQLAETKTSLQDAITRVEEDVENLKNQAGIDPTSLDPISQGLAELKSNLDALDPDPENPPAPA